MKRTSRPGAVHRSNASVGLFELGTAHGLEALLPGLRETQEGGVVARIAEVGPGVAERDERVNVGHAVEAADGSVVAEDDLPRPAAQDGPERLSGLGDDGLAQLVRWLAIGAPRRLEVQPEQAHRDEPEAPTRGVLARPIERGSHGGGHGVERDATADEPPLARGRSTPEQRSSDGRAVGGRESMEAGGVADDPLEHGQVHLRVRVGDHDRAAALERASEVRLRQGDDQGARVAPLLHAHGHTVAVRQRVMQRSEHTRGVAQLLGVGDRLLRHMDLRLVDGRSLRQAPLGQGAGGAVDQGAHLVGAHGLGECRSGVGRCVGLGDVDPAIERLDDRAHRERVASLERVEPVARVGEVVAPEHDGPQGCGRLIDDE